MESRGYKQPSSAELNNFIAEVRHSPDIPLPTKALIISYFDALKVNKPPEVADKLIIGALIWFNEAEADYTILSKTMLNKGLRLTPENQIDNKLKFRYLTTLANHMQSADVKFGSEQSKKESRSISNSLKDQIAVTALAVLEKIPFKQIPLELMESFKVIPHRRETYPLSLWRQTKKYVSDYSSERTKQTFFIDTASKLIATLAKNEEPFDYKSIIMAMTYYLMYDLENECSTRQPASVLYKFLAAVAKIKHSSEVTPENQQLYFDVLYQFIEKIPIEQWKKSKPKGAEAFDIKLYVDKIYRTLPLIRLSANPPRSLTYSAVCGVASIVPTALSCAKDFVLLTFANELYMVRGIGKNSIIVRIAAQIGEYLASYAGSFAGYFIKKSIFEIGEAAERRAMVFSITGMLRVTIGYLSTKELTEHAAATIYDPSSDPFEALINLALIHAKKEAIINDCLFFESLLSLYRILPSPVKTSLMQSVDKKRAAEITTVATTPSSERKEELVTNAMSVSEKKLAITETPPPAKKGGPPPAPDASLMKKVKPALSTAPTQERKEVASMRM